MTHHRPALQHKYHRHSSSNFSRRLLTIALGSVLGVSTATQAVTLPNTFTNGNAANADEVNANFKALADAINNTPAGSIGPIGPEGVKGDIGPDGPVGPAGAKGDMGPDGPAGPEGAKGDIGPEGPVGPAGAKGDMGPDGPVGPAGAKGDIGPVGPAGPEGAKGDTGSKGDTGATGDPGPMGFPGLASPSGAYGPMGPMGAKGDKGDKGEPGINFITAGNGIAIDTNPSNTNEKIIRLTPGVSKPLGNMQPYLVVNCSVSTEGMFPARNFGGDDYLGSIHFSGFNFSPLHSLPCDGQLISINQNPALFALLGTTYGGNGTTTFALPDMRGRVPVGQGLGPGLTPRALGEAGGNETTVVNNQ